MSWRYVLTTKLKTRDPVEATAEHTIRYDLALGETLNKLTRYDFWEITLADDLGLSETEKGHVESVEGILRQLAEDTRVFVNPNKHEYSIISSENIRAESLSAGIHRIPVSVRSLDDRRGISALKTLTSLYGFGSKVVKVESGVLWMLDILADSIEIAREKAVEIVETRHRCQGLLANLHYETSQIYK
ncbi:hypothetical protein K8T06_07910 [bacterium]|nr:hypothetical protein [bacterium]